MESNQRDGAWPSSRGTSNEKEPTQLEAQDPTNGYQVDVSSPGASGDRTERRLKSRHIQLMGVGGAVGTALFVQIGQGLLDGGPASLFLAFSLW